MHLSKRQCILLEERRMIAKHGPLLTRARQKNGDREIRMTLWLELKSSLGPSLWRAALLHPGQRAAQLPWHPRSASWTHSISVGARSGVACRAQWPPRLLHASEPPADPAGIARV